MTTDPHVPANYHTVMPYLIVENATRFLSFTEEVFGAKELYRAMRDVDTIMHAEIMIGDSTIMFADATEKYKPIPAGLFIYVDNADERFRKAINAGAKVINEVSDQTYGRSGGVIDPFGNSWWVTSVNPTKSP
jgi:PhnB protein